MAASTSVTCHGETAEVSAEVVYIHQIFFRLSLVFPPDTALRLGALGLLGALGAFGALGALGALKAFGAFFGRGFGSGFTISLSAAFASAAAL